MEEEEHEVYGGEIPVEAEMDGDMNADVDMSAADGDAVKELDEMKKRLKEMEEEATALREMQAKVEKEMGAVQDPAAATSQANKEEVDSRSIFVGNVDYACTPEEVQQHFQSCGTVNRVTILTDKFGQPKGFAYVEFLEMEAVQEALSLNESELHGQQLKQLPQSDNQRSLALSIWAMEEHPDPPPLNPASTTVHSKHVAMLHRLSNAKQTKSSSTDTFESTQSFLTLFSQHKLSIDSSLSSASSLSDVAPISASISALEALVAESSYFLPPYELRTCLRTIQSLKQTLETLSSRIAPKKPFSFKNKSKPSSALKPEPETRMPQSPESAFSVSESPGTRENEVLSKESNSGECIVSDLNKLKPSNLQKPEAETRLSELSISTYSVLESPGFQNRKNEVLSKKFLGSEMGEFIISNLDSCEVRLRGCFRALFVHKLKNCRIYSGPVSGSVLIEEVEDCVFVLASHQIRIHNSKRCDFYLRVRSRPIIEDCGGVRFAPYCLGYEGIGKDLGEVKLDEENGNWGNVDDFKWLKGFQSPNWSVLAESERIGQVIISESDK